MRYAINEASLKQIHCFLKQNDNLFNPPFSSSIDLNQYSNKLKSKATLYELWDGVELIGILASYYNSSDNSIFIPYICVNRVGQGSGLFSFFLTQIAEGKVVYLEVRKNNTKAISFYKKFRFCIISQSDEKFLLKREV